jgi:hypothetical protein
MENFKKQVIPDTFAMPANIELEAALVNLLTLPRNGSVKIEVFCSLSPEAFYDTAYRAIYAAEKRLFDEGRSVDYGTVFSSLSGDEKNAFVSSANSKFAQGYSVLELAENIQNLHSARRMIECCYAGIHACSEPIIAADFLTTASELIVAIDGIVEKTDSTDGGELLGGGDTAKIWEKYLNPDKSDVIPSGIHLMACWMAASTDKI